MSLCELSLSELLERLERKEVSAHEAARSYLERITALDGKLGAYLRVDERGALAAAEAIDARRARGEPVGPLAGAPIALKDIFVTEGLETTCASKILRGWIPPYQGTPARRLSEAGAVLLGKLNMDEFAMGSSGENSAFGPTRNPWDTACVPGGSSSGSAAAVAAGLCAASLGTDTGGSIRQPASFCGIVGLKPTYGRVSRYGVVAFASSLDQVGPMTRTVRDAALMLEAVAGHDPRDATSLPVPVPRYREAVGRGAAGVRIGVPAEYFVAGMDPAVEASVRAALGVLEGLGATLVEVSLPHTKYSLPTYYLVAPAEASSNLARYDGVRFGQRAEGVKDLGEMYERSRAEGFGPEVKRRIVLGTYALRAGYYEAYYGKALRVRRLIADDFARAFERCDVIACPTSPTTAFPLGARADDPVAMYLADVLTLACNLAGIPGMSVPCGFSPAGLPIGLQLLGPALGEERLLQVAGAYEGATDHTRRRPPLG